MCGGDCPSIACRRGAVGATSFGDGLHTDAAYKEAMESHVRRNALWGWLAVPAWLPRFREVSEDDLDLIFGCEGEVVALIEEHVRPLRCG